jgi:hypothetical protein
MSAPTAEKPRSRSAQLSATLEQRYEERAQLEQRLLEIPGLEEAARVAAIKAKPTERSDRMNTPVQRLRREQSEKAAALDRLNAEISALERVVALARREDLESQLAATEKEAATLANAEAELWRQAGDQRAALAETFAQLRDEAWEPRERRREDLRHGTYASLLNHDEAQEAFQAVWRNPIRPLPTTFPAFVALLVEAAADPKGLGYRAVTGGAHLDAESRLTGLIPDLAGETTRPVELLRTERWSPPS